MKKLIRNIFKVDTLIIPSDVEFVSLDSDSVYASFEDLRERLYIQEGLVYDVLNSIYMRKSNHTIIETSKSPTIIVNEIFNDSNYWDSVYDALDRGLSNVRQNKSINWEGL